MSLYNRHFRVRFLHKLFAGKELGGAHAANVDARGNAVQVAQQQPHQVGRVLRPRRDEVQPGGQVEVDVVGARAERLGLGFRLSS